MNGAYSRSGSDRESPVIRPGAAGLMTSFPGWRRHAKSAVMLRSAARLPAPETSAPVKRDRRYPTHLLAGAAFGALALGSPALAADIKLPVKAPYQSVFDWTGFYIGGHTGFGRGSSSAVLTDPAVSTT